MPPFAFSTFATFTVRALLFALALAVVSACSSSRRAPPVDPQHVVILVPGFKGTTLVDEHDRTVWISAREALWGSARLAIPWPALGIVNSSLRPSEVLGAVPVVPLLYRYDVYGSFVRFVERRCERRCRLVTLPYDWRLDNAHTAGTLADLVRRERAEGAASITIVGHSMGGLVTSYYLRYGGQDPDHAIESWEGASAVDAVVLAGVPFRGALEMFHDMQFGDVTGYNDTLLDGESLSSFPSSYQLLPFDGATPVRDERGAPIDLFSGRTWEASSWGLFRGGASITPEVRAARRAFVHEKLRRGRRFLELVHAPYSGPGTGLPALGFVGRGRPTLCDATTGAGGALAFRASPACPGSDGDAIVSVASATLPVALADALDEDVRDTAELHSAILAGAREQAAMGALLDRVAAESRTGAGPFRQRVRFHSPPLS